MGVCFARLGNSEIPRLRTTIPEIPRAPANALWVRGLEPRQQFHEETARETKERNSRGERKKSENLGGRADGSGAGRSSTGRSRVVEGPPRSVVQIARVRLYIDKKMKMIQNRRVASGLPNNGGTVRCNFIATYGTYTTKWPVARQQMGNN